MKTFNRTVWVLGIAAAAAGCAAPDGEGAGMNESEAPATSSQNGLSSINGLSSLNGLSSINGLSSLNGLSSINGLASNVGLMTSASGRTTVSYLVRCALPAGRTITKKDQYGTSYSYSGQMGFAPEWEYGACGKDCQENITACMMAHVNTAGVHIPLWIDAAKVGWGRSTSYPHQEGSFFGNIFTSPPTAYYCNGKDFDQGVVPGRLGATQTNAPYKNPLKSFASGFCRDTCTPADIPAQNDGYKACYGYNSIVTVWRQ